MPYPDWRAGQRMTADLLAAMNVYEVEQGSDQTVTSSTVYVDTNIVIPVEANALYTYTLLADASGDVAGDGKVAWTVPSGTTMKRSGQGVGQSNTASQTDAATMFSAQGGASTDFGFGVGTGTTAFVEDGRIETGSTSGNVTLQFAQRVSNATGSIFRGTSIATYRRIG